MRRLPNIAISGKLRSGKNAVADYLAEKYGYTAFAFGDEMKRYAHELFNVDASAKPRELYQWFGQTMRARDPDIWVRKCLERITFTYAVAEVNGGTIAGTPVVITDLRQPNEFDRCRAEGYVIIRVNCADEIRLERARAAGDTFTLAELNHETELHVDSFAVEYDVDNSGSLAELYTQMDTIMTEVSTW